MDFYKAFLKFEYGFGIVRFSSVCSEEGLIFKCKPHNHLYCKTLVDPYLTHSPTLNESSIFLNLNDSTRITLTGMFTYIPHTFLQWLFSFCFWLFSLALNFVKVQLFQQSNPLTFNHNQIGGNQYLELLFYVFRSAGNLLCQSRPNYN